MRRDDSKIMQMIHVRHIHGDAKYANVFLTYNWTLYIDSKDETHESAMLRIGLSSEDVILSGCATKHGVTFRYSKPLGNYDDNELRKFMNPIRWLCKPTIAALRERDK